MNVSQNNMRNIPSRLG